jgi:hypothetical protein
MRARTTLAAVLLSVLPRVAGAQEPAGSAEEISDPTEEERWLSDDYGWAFKAFAGPAYRQLFSVPILLAEAELAGGVESPVGGWYGTGALRFGSTLEGLWTVQVAWGQTWEAPLGPWRLGLGPQFSWVGIKRATTGDMMWDFGLGTRLFATFDVYATEHAAVFTGLRAGSDWLVGSDSDIPVLWGVSVPLGVRVY